MRRHTSSPSSPGISTSRIDRVGGLDGQRADRLTAVHRGRDLEAVEVEHQCERFPYRGVVVDDQQTHGAMLATERERKLNVRWAERAARGPVPARAALV